MAKTAVDYLYEEISKRKVTPIRSRTKTVIGYTILRAAQRTFMLYVYS